MLQSPKSDKVYFGFHCDSLVFLEATHLKMDSAYMLPTPSLPPTPFEPSLYLRMQLEAVFGIIPIQAAVVVMACTVLGILY